MWGLASSSVCPVVLAGTGFPQTGVSQSPMAMAGEHSAVVQMLHCASEDEPAASEGSGVSYALLPPLGTVPSC